jgi:hypothetical protein
VFIIKYFLLVTSLLILCLQSQADERIEKLKKLLENDFITEAEFKKLLNTTTKQTSKIKVKQISGKTGKEKFEKYEFYIDNFRVHTLNPGTIRIDNMLTGETDVVLSSNFKVKITKYGLNFFRFDYDSEDLKGDLFYKGRKIINWTGRYVSRYQATFHQMQVDGIQPFHYFIVLPGKNPISINYKVFEKKIDKAVTKVKKEMSLKYNLTLEDIDKIMETKESTMSKEQEKIIKDLVNEYAGKEITEEIRKEIENTVGQEMANAFISEIEAVTGQAIDDAVERELASAIDEAVAYAVQQGVSEAIAAAAIEAMITVYALGGSDEDALNACRSIAGDAC